VQPARTLASSHMRDSHRRRLVLVGALALGAGLTWGYASGDQCERPSQICRPVVEPSPPIVLGQAGHFSWKCVDGQEAGTGYYMVFVRPNGTYVLLKVPHGRTSFEFTPDTAGVWRWIVINTDPDRTKPDLESEPGQFQVTEVEAPAP
jgi:hypothetical protein